jgi:hypothetical protein
VGERSAEPVELPNDEDIAVAQRFQAGGKTGAIITATGCTIIIEALLQRLAAVRGRLSLCADQAAAAKWWLSMPMASVSAEGPMPSSLHKAHLAPDAGLQAPGASLSLRRARMTSIP